MKQFHANVWREDDLFVAQCLEVDIASQGQTADDALTNLREAIELFFESADPQEQADRTRELVRTAEIEVSLG